MGIEEQRTSTANGYDPLVGRVLAGRYRVEALISEGGMGRVYRAVQVALDRSVAIKTVLPHLAASPAIVSRFMAEARTASRLNHPGIVQIYDFGQLAAAEGGDLFLVMELLSGRDLASELAAGPMPLGRAHSILTQVLAALGEAHAQGVTHRDAKPENIYLERGKSGEERIKIIDFGIAKAHGAQRVTSVGHFVGTPHYMPPEQIRGERAEVTADLYAVGVILFQMLTGRLPFDDEAVMTVLSRQLGAPRPDPRVVAPSREIPPAVAQVCLRAIAIDPARRFASAEEFAQALGDAVAGAVPTSPSARPARVPPGGLATPPWSAHRPSGRYSSQPEPRERTPTPAMSGARRESPQQSAFETIVELERRARHALGRGEVSEGIALLERGVRFGRELVLQGDKEVGIPALSAFGRRLAEVLREQGQLAASEGVLSEILGRGELDPGARGRALEQLAVTLVRRGRVEEARRALIDALQGARHSQDRLLAAQIEAQLRALGSTRRLDGPSRPSTVPPRQSEWRVRDGAGERKRRDGS